MVQVIEIIPCGRHLSSLFNIMTADGLATEGAKAWAVMVLTQLSWSILVSQLQMC